MATTYKTLADSDKTILMNLASGVFTDNHVDGSIQYPIREYRDVHAQFKTFPSKYIFEGIEAGLSPEDISNNIYNWMKYGTDTPKNYGNMSNFVPMKNITQGVFGQDDQENMLRYICGKVLVTLQTYVQ